MKRVSPSYISIGLLNKLKMKRKMGDKLKNVITYLKSDSHMYSSLLSDKLSSPCFSPVDTTIFGVKKGGMATKRTKKKNKFLHKLVDYLKSDCYMYAPLVGCSAAPESNTASKITQPSKRARKRPYGKNSSPRSTLVKNTLAFRREEKCLINPPAGRSPSSSGGKSKKFKIPETNTIWTGEELLKIFREGV